MLTSRLQEVFMEQTTRQITSMKHDKYLIAGILIVPSHRFWLPLHNAQIYSYLLSFYHYSSYHHPFLYFDYFSHNAKRGHFLNFFRKCPLVVLIIKLNSNNHFAYCYLFLLMTIKFLGQKLVKSLSQSLEPLILLGLFIE